MSWGGQQQAQAGYAGYGQPQYGQPPHGQPPHGQPPQGMYRGPAPAQGYGAPPTQHGYGAPPRGQSYGAPPTAYGAPGQHPPPQNTGAPAYTHNMNPGYGGQFNAPPAYGSAPGPQGGGYGGGGQFSAPPPPGVSPDIWTWFQAVDLDRSGKITSNELQQALMNGNWSPFNGETCRLMIGMFDKDRSGTIDVHEFSALWKYIQDWKGCFDRFDTDRSGNIDANELANAFRQFGYSLSAQFSQIVVRVFDRKKGGYNINFDDFIQACVMLKSLTDKFRVKDTSQNGMIQLSYEEFLEMVLDTTLKK